MEGNGIQSTTYFLDGDLEGVSIFVKIWKLGLDIQFFQNLEMAGPSSITKKLQFPDYWFFYHLLAIARDWELCQRLTIVNEWILFQLLPILQYLVELPETDILQILGYFQMLEAPNKW